MELKCGIYEKLRKGEELSAEERKALKEIIKKELKFLAEQGILPTPDNYARWFFVFCYVVENGVELSVKDLIDLYYRIFKEAKIDLHKAEGLEKIVTEVKETLKNYMETVKRYDREIGEKGEKLKEDVEKTNLELLKEILGHVVELRKTNASLLEKLREQERQIDRLREELKILKEKAYMDYLTGLRNRRSIEKALEDYLKDLKAYGYPFSVIMMDLDKFKEINDTYGHLVGDCVLKEIAEILRKYLRAKDVVGRYGGDEFIIILPGVEKDIAVRIAERLRNIIKNHSFKCDNWELKLSASFGIVQVDKSFKSTREILEKADEKLYEAKKSKKGIAY
ncbi:MAG: diguanylate cyclase [Aquificae bacterium]|nr:diguanylate cyclase [Aquificota bacterium]